METKDIANDVERWFDTSNYDENDDIQKVMSKRYEQKSNWFV